MPRFLLEGYFDVSFYVFPVTMPSDCESVWQNAEL